MIKIRFNTRLFHIFLLAVICLSGYSNTFNVPFHFDDKPAIVENPIIKDMSYLIEPSNAKNFQGSFEYTTFKRRYIGYLTFALNYKFHGLDVRGYHVVNLLIHFLNAVLVYFFIIVSFKTPFLQKSSINDRSVHIAIIAALLFASHPIQTQAVTYIWQRVTSLTTTFYVFSLLMYVQGRLMYKEKRFSAKGSGKTVNIKFVFCYVLSAASAVLAMKTKEISFTLPIMVVLYEFMFFEGKLSKRIIYLIPIIITILIIPLSLMNIDRPIGDLIGDVGDISKETKTISRSDYLFTQFRVIVTYIRILLFPVNQNLDYDYPIHGSFFNSGVLLSFLFLLLILVIGGFLFYRYRNTLTHTRLISFGIFWFFISLSVESSIIPIQDVIFEHRVYLPSIGVFVALSNFILLMAEGKKDQWKNIDKILISSVIIITLILTSATYARNKVWKDEFSLWKDVVNKNHNNGRAHLSLGVAFKSKGQIDKAIEHYQISRNLNPMHPMPPNNLGLAYSSKGFIDKAIEQFQIAIKLNPYYSDAYYNLGIAYNSKGEIDKSIEQYQIAIKLNPGHWRAYFNLGNAYRFQRNLDMAIEQYKISIRLNPIYAEAYNNLGSVYGSKGIMRSALDNFKTALKLNPNHAGAYYNLGIIFQSQGLLDKALENYKIATKLNPGMAGAQFNLGVIYLKKGDMNMAQSTFKKVLQINSKHQGARKLLESIIHEKRNN
jgi:tetratricopeptide (TPR) repeat protein